MGKPVRRSMSVALAFTFVCGCAEPLGFGSVEFGLFESVPAQMSVDGGESAKSIRQKLRKEALFVEANTAMDGTIGGLQRAHALLALAKELDPDDARSVDGLGCIAFRMQRFDEAAQLFEAARRMDSDYARGHAHLGLVKLMEGKWQEARALLELARRLDPLDPETRNNLAVLEREGGSNNKSNGAVRTELLKAVALDGPAVVYENLEILNNIEESESQGWKPK